jgi:hypothetical protein
MIDANTAAGLDHDFNAWAGAFLGSAAQTTAAQAVANEKEASLGESSDDEDGSGDEIGDMEDLVGGEAKPSNGGMLRIIAVMLGRNWGHGGSGWRRGHAI